MRLGIDTGGTFTDAVLFDNEKGVVQTAKALTTHYDLAVGIREVIDKIDKNEKPLSELINLTSISTTLATNSIVEGRGGSICLLLIGHTPKSLDRSNLKSALRGDPVEFISGGHSAYGEEIVPLNSEEIKEVILRHADSVTAFAVAGMFSVRNPEHEIFVRNSVLEHTSLPVTCSFELSANLDAPRRAMTTVLNARLIAPISQLIQTVRLELKNRNIQSSLMVVKGDGSMVSADVAAYRPVETVLSGPAASVIGAATLAKESIDVISDIGGTTTDIAILCEGKPVLARQGAHIGKFRTFVEAINVHTDGLGGDSQVSFDLPLSIGPVRALPICSLAKKAPSIISILEDQLKRRPQEYQGCFLTRRRSSVDVKNLARTDQKLWTLLDDGPISCEELFRDPRMLRSYNRMRTLDLVQIAAFTPTDALHVLGKMSRWPIEAAVLAARIWTRGFEKFGEPRWTTVEDLCVDVIEEVIQKTSRMIIRSVLSDEEAEHQNINSENVLLHKGVATNSNDLLGVEFFLRGNLAVVGAPASSFYPEIGRRLNTNILIPEHSEVGNAVGAAAGMVSQRVVGLITSPAEGIYRAHTPTGIEDFKNLDSAAIAVTDQLKQLAQQKALTANATNPEVIADRSDVKVKGPGGSSVFIESRIAVTVSGHAHSST